MPGGGELGLLERASSVQARDTDWLPKAGTGRVPCLEKGEAGQTRVLLNPIQYSKIEAGNSESLILP